jgi:pimeloyl-ACP methyl ester carboxylesterase
VLRYRTDRDEDYLGSLVVNPGGPGGSGIDYARAARAITTDAVRARYDIVGFDPRGVATSDPIDCLDDKQTDAFIAADASPDDAAEAARLTALSAQFGASCQANSPNLVGHISTRDVAKDMDILRQALGDQKLAYLGKSYGTAIGSTYAELFPQNVGRLVLDGAIDPALDLTEMGKGQALGFELALSRFFAACPTLDGCPFPKDAAAASAKLAGLLDRIDASPLPAQPGRPLTQALAVLGIVGNLYSPDSWPELAYALSAAFEGDGNALLNSADYYADRNTDGTYNSNANDALYAVNCYDRPATPGATETAALASAWEKQAPHFGAYLAWGNLPCATWPAHSGTCRRTRSRPPAPRRSSSSAPVTTRPRRSAGPRRWPASSTRECCWSGSATATPPTRRAAAASTRRSTPSSSTASPRRTAPSAGSHEGHPRTRLCVLTVPSPVRATAARTPSRAGTGSR